MITSYAVIEDYINGVNAGVNLAFLYFEVVSFQTTLTGSIGCNTQKYTCMCTCRHKKLFTVLLASFVFQIKADTALLMKHSYAFILRTNKQFRV